MLFNLKNLVLAFQKNLNKLFKANLLQKLFVFFLLLLLICIIFNYFNKSPREGFEQKKQFTVFTNADIYDDFYVTIYDDLVYNKVKNEYEIGEIINHTKPTSNSKLLDIGCGTGHHLDACKDKFSDLIGIDVSPSMIKKAQSNYPALKYKRANALDNMIFESNQFTHITCFYFTIYYMKNKNQFFQNTYGWLMPGGYLVLHLVDPDKFDPIIPAGDPTIIISPQKYSKKRITNTVVKFDNYEYKSNFDMLSDKENSGSNLDSDSESGPANVKFAESIRNTKTGDVRINNHMLYMSSQKDIINQAKKVGFTLLKIVDLKECKYDHQYLYILKKPE